VTVTTEIGSAALSDLVKQVQAGVEIVLTEGDKPVARLVPATESPRHASPLFIPLISGHRVIDANISQGEIADEIFAR
jgi:antitoxin (DNA-binding transcriptional repressor) of toxin-antitoxin stability system